MSGQLEYTEAKKLAKERGQKFSAGDDVVQGAKKTGKNSDAREYYMVGCPCGWRFGKQDQERTADRAHRLHTKVCKVAQEEATKYKGCADWDKITTARGGIVSKK
jgi:hypothetical protein